MQGPDPEAKGLNGSPGGQGGSVRPLEHSARGPLRPPDHSAWGIIGANAFAIVVAVWQGWGLVHLLWPFWIQSVVIGYYWRRRILLLNEFCTEGVRINDRPVEPTPETARMTGNFFGLHYGGFHLIYLFFLLGFSFGADAQGVVVVTEEGTGVEHLVRMGRMSVGDLPYLGAVALSFWLTHRASFREHVAADLARRPNIGTLMFLPYARVLPMHLTIILAVPLGGLGAIWLFALLKTGADVLMHKVEHGWMQEGLGKAGSPHDLATPP